MQIPSIATVMNGVAPRDATSSSTTGTTSGSTASSTTPTDPLTQESTFLKLLVAQIQNQDPLNPTDSIQFVGQLVQYSELEQLLGINQNTQALVAAQTNSGTPPPASGSGSQPTQ